MKAFRILLVLLTSTTIGQAATLYYQDFSNSSPVSDQAGNNPILDNTPVTTMVAGEVITGGSAGEQATNGDYTITINTVYDEADYYIFNEAGDAGFKYDDSKYTFESGTISFQDGGTTYSGTIKLSGKCNTGGEFFSINSVELVKNDQTGEVYLDVDFNFFADTAEGQTDSLFLTLDFGINDVVNLELEELIGVPLGGNTTGTGVYRHGLIEVLEASFVEAEEMTLDGFSIEAQTNAAGEQVIVLDGISGAASQVLDLTGAGFYDIRTAYFDENDGDAVYKLFLDDALIDAWSASRDLDRADPDAQNLVEHKTVRVSLRSGQTLELLAYADGGEPCRVDGIALDPSAAAPGTHSMSWNADGTVSSLMLSGAEQLSAQTGRAELRIFNGDDMKSFDMVDAVEQNSMVEVIDEAMENVGLHFRMEEYDNFLLFRLIGTEQLPLYDSSLNIRVTLPVSDVIHVVSLDENTEV